MSTCIEQIARQAPTEEGVERTAPRPMVVFDNVFAVTYPSVADPLRGIAKRPCQWSPLASPAGETELPNIRFEKIEKSSGSVLSPDRLAFDTSEFTVLVGPSGCGKSTTFRILAGLESPDAGESYFNGSPIRHFAPMDRNITMVFQDHALYPHMNIAKNMVLDHGGIVYVTILLTLSFRTMDIDNAEHN